MDQSAKGVKRTLGCTCRSSPRTCPVNLAINLVRAFADSGISAKTAGKTMKSAVVGAWAKAAGKPVQGHSPRRSGALFYTRAGLSIPDITYLGRWQSDLVFQYAEEAWEDTAMNAAQTRAGQGKARTKSTSWPAITARREEHGETSKDGAETAEESRAIPSLRWTRS